MKVYKLKYLTDREQGLNALMELQTNLMALGGYHLERAYFASSVKDFKKVYHSGRLDPVRGFSFQAPSNLFLDILDQMNGAFENLYFYSNTIHEASENLGYSFMLRPHLNQYNFEIKLPYWHSKEINIRKTREVLNHFNNQKAIYIQPERVEDLSEQLISNSWDSFSRNEWICKNDFNQYSTWPNVQPKVNGVLQESRPSGITIKSLDELSETGEFENSRPIKLVKVFESFHKTGYEIKGHIRTEKLIETLDYFDSNADIKVVIPCRERNISIDNILDMGDIESCKPTKNISWLLKDFQWKKSLHNHPENQIEFFSNDFRDYDFEIHISEQNGQEELKKVEEVLNMDIEFAYNC